MKDELGLLKVMLLHLLAIADWREHLGPSISRRLAKKGVRMMGFQMREAIEEELKRTIAIRKIAGKVLS